MRATPAQLPLLPAPKRKSAGLPGGERRRRACPSHSTLRPLARRAARPGEPRAAPQVCACPLRPARQAPGGSGESPAAQPGSRVRGGPQVGHCGVSGSAGIRMRKKTEIRLHARLHLPSVDKMSHFIYQSTFEQVRCIAFSHHFI